MLQAIRSKAGSLVVKILFALLIVSFGVWGIGDIFRERSAAETTVANVGDVKIQADELQLSVRREMDRMNRMLGGNFTAEQAKQIGLVDTVLDRIIAADLLDLEERRLKLLVDDQVVRDAIMANPAFHNSTGAFDRNLFTNILASNQLTEDRYVGLLRHDIARGNLTSAIAGGAVAPIPLVETLFRTRNEKRVGDTVLVASAKVTGVAEASEAELQDFHAKHEDLFRAPEYRGFTALIMKPEDIAASIDVPESKLRDEYQSRLDEFQTPDRRQLEQILVPDEAKAKEVETQLAAGKDFTAVAKDVADQGEDTVKLGWVKREELPPELADATFALKDGEIGKPTQSPLGWHIIKVTGVEVGSTKPFEAVSDQLHKDVAREMAADELYKRSNEIEDALAGGATLDQVAEKFALKPTKIAAGDLDGKDPAGAPVALPNADEILRVAFNTDQGQTTRMNETKDNGYFILHVDSVQPSVIKPLAEVKDRTKELYLADKQSTAAETEAKAISAAVTADKTLAAIAAEKQVAVTTTPAVTRRGSGQANLPASVVAKMFDIKPGETAVTSGPDGWYVVQLKTIDIPDPATDSATVTQVTEQLTEGMRGDILSQFEKALRNRYPVTVRQQEIDRLL
ncbi:MAG TPA: peptidyl-prolyl cis-trans isomerase [Stellaceae bacterium]|jgi:peptidyl-prolyl cis-trans isomerase D|nr:peptidyl-prolyl cis-trans isomerase [Stellaceae bacterium]